MKQKKKMQQTYRCNKKQEQDEEKVHQENKCNIKTKCNKKTNATNKQNATRKQFQMVFCVSVSISFTFFIIMQQ